MPEQLEHSSSLPASLQGKTAFKGSKLFSRNCILFQVLLLTIMPLELTDSLFRVCLCVFAHKSISLMHLNQETWSNLCEVGGMRVV